MLEVLVDLSDHPSPLLLSLLEELLILLEAATSTLRLVQPGPDASEDIGRSKNEKNPVVEVVEQNRGEQSDCEVGQSPDDHTDCCALCTRGGWEYLSGNEPDGGEPADTESTSGYEQ